MVFFIAKKGQLLHGCFKMSYGIYFALQCTVCFDLSRIDRRGSSYRG